MKLIVFGAALGWWLAGGWGLCCGAAGAMVLDDLRRHLC